MKIIVNLIINLCTISILCAICNTLFESLFKKWIQIFFNILFFISIVLSIISITKGTNLYKYTMKKIAPSIIESIELELENKRNTINSDI